MVRKLALFTHTKHHESTKVVWGRIRFEGGGCCSVFKTRFVAEQNLSVWYGCISPAK